MNIDKRLKEYFRNSDIYQKRFENIETARQECPWLTSNANTMLGAVDNYYVNIAKIINKSLESYNQGIKILLDVKKGIKIENMIIKKNIEFMDGLDNHLDNLSKYMKKTFIPFYKGMKGIEEVLLETKYINRFLR